MTFTDDDLKRLGELDATASIHDKYANEENRRLVHALFARLEAAEAVIRQLVSLNSEAKNDSPVIEAWRKAAGK